MGRRFGNRVAFTSTTVGVGDVTVDGLVGASYVLPSEAGYVNGDNTYLLLQDGNNFEISDCTYIDASPDRFSRDTVLISKEAGVVGTSKLTLSGSTQVRVIAPSQLIQLLYGGVLAPETDVASAATTDLGAVGSGKVRITGTTTITSFGSATAGIRIEGRFAGALTLTHNATSLILPGGANIATAAGDRFIAYSLGSGNWVVLDYIRAAGVTAGSYGSASQIPNLTLNARGEITNISTSAVTVPAAATQAEQEAASSTSVYVSPGRQQFHPAAAKVWSAWGVTSTIDASYNVSSITDNTTGSWTVNFSTAFSSANYAALCTVRASGSAMVGALKNSTAPTASTCDVVALDGSNNTADSLKNYFAAFGDQ